MANDWEPVYVYWKTSNPVVPTLLDVYTRAHFVWIPVAGSQVLLNGTQPLVTFSATYHVPTVRTTVFLKPTNTSIAIPFNQNQFPPFVPGSWYYPVTNGGPHTLLVWLDSGSPPATGPTAYENDVAGNAGPADPLQVLGDTSAIRNGFIAGAFATLGIYLVFIAVEVDIAGFRKLLLRRK